MEFRTARLPARFKPEGINALVRIGSVYDGGYVIAAHVLAETKAILTFGLGLNWDFEREMDALPPVKTIHCYDHTVSYDAIRKEYAISLLKYFNKKTKRRRKIELFKDYRDFFRTSKRIQHFEKEVCTITGDKKSTVNSAFGFIANPKHVFLKCDIEGAEYNVSDQIVENASKCCGIVIEFHDLHNRENDFESIMQGLMETHLVDHIHVNTHCELSESGLPSVVEVSMSRKVRNLHQSEIGELSGLAQSLVGTSLDFPNHPDHADIQLTYGS